MAPITDMIYSIIIDTPIELLGKGFVLKCTASRNPPASQLQSKTETVSR